MTDYAAALGRHTDLLADRLGLPRPADIYAAAARAALARWRNRP